MVVFWKLVRRLGFATAECFSDRICRRGAQGAADDGACCLKALCCVAYAVPSFLLSYAYFCHFFSATAFNFSI